MTRITAILTVEYYMDLDVRGLNEVEPVTRERALKELEIAYSEGYNGIIDGHTITDVFVDGEKPPWALKEDRPGPMYTNESPNIPAYGTGE